MLLSQLPNLKLRIGKLMIPTNPNMWVKYLFLFFCFFPYIKIIPFIETDIQPYALVFSMLLLVIWIPASINIGLLIPLVVMSLALIIISINGLSIVGVRNSFGYFSFFSISYASYKYLINQAEFPFQFITFAIYTWMVVGIVQLVFPDFLTFLLPRENTGFGRGVVALAPEPTFYGITCLFFMLILQISDHPKSKLLTRILLFQIVILSQSSMVILFLIILLTLYVVVNLNLKRLMSFAAFSIAGSVLLLNLDLTKYSFRFLRIIDLAMSKGLYKIIAIDESISDRVAHIFFSVKGFFENYMLPHGYGVWGEYLEPQLPNYRGVFVIDWISRGDKIMSTYGAALYELGIFGLLLPLAISIILYRGLRFQGKKQFVIIVFVNVILMTAIPVSFPPIAFLMGTALYKSKMFYENTFSA